RNQGRHRESPPSFWMECYHEVKELYETQDHCTWRERESWQGRAKLVGRARSWYGLIVAVKRFASRAPMCWLRSSSDSTGNGRPGPFGFDCGAWQCRPESASRSLPFSGARLLVAMDNAARPSSSNCCRTSSMAVSGSVKN